MAELKDKVQLNKVTHSVRASQAVLQYGVGAMVDFPEQTLMTAAPEMWASSVVEIHDERLEKALHVDFFGMPGSSDDARYQSGIAYARFPEWYFCPKCRRFQSLKEWVKDYKSNPKSRRFVENDPYMVKHLRCPSCGQDLVVARIIVACENGHIDDFPWVKWVHAKNGFGARKVCECPKLKFTTSASSTEGLEGLTITCETCHSRATLRGAFDPNSLEELDKKTSFDYDFSCTGRHPWKNTREVCTCHPRVLQRGGSSVYFPIAVSSLVIPPYSSQLTAKIQSSIYFSELKKSITDTIKSLTTLPVEITQEMRETVISQKINEYASKIANDIGKSEKQVKPILQRRWNGNADESYTTTSVKYRAEEYEALGGEVVLDDKKGEFVRESTNIENYNLPFVKNISLIHKVREVQALIGYSRIEPVDGETQEEDSKIKKISIKESDTNWYPGYDVRGEGIFIEFDSDAINNWRSQNEQIQKRLDQINDNYSKSYYGEKRPRSISAKFLLLHTISHLLMKQLSFECGYSIASIKERIYCSEQTDGKEMSGIFIYTASGDSEGTMGGLVRQGRSDTFPFIFKKAIESALSCSNDPVCSLSMGQGRDSLNLAACYSCTLVPETSCEEFNVFLDRGVVTGTFEEPRIGFYSEYVLGKVFENKVPQKSAAKKSSQQFLVTEMGADLSSTTFESIWKSILQFSKEETEKKLLEQLITNASSYTDSPHPYQGGSFQIIGDSEYYNVDLLWPAQKVMVFSEENTDEYEMVKNMGWKCFLLTDSAVMWNDIVEAIKKE